MGINESTDQKTGEFDKGGQQVKKRKICSKEKTVSFQWTLHKKKKSMPSHLAALASHMHVLDLAAAGNGMHTSCLTAIEEAPKILFPISGD